MGPITFLLHRMPLTRAILRRGRPGTPDVLAVVYAAAGLSTISLAFGPHAGPAIREADSARRSSHSVVSSPTGADRRLHLTTRPRGLPTRELHRSARVASTREGLRPRTRMQRSWPTRDSRARTPSEIPQSQPSLPPAEPLLISDVSAAVSDSTVRLSWLTNFAATAQEGYGNGDAPVLWGESGSAGVIHDAVIGGLAPSTEYVLWLQSVDDWGRIATTELPVTTASSESQRVSSATVSGGSILLDAKPFFPLALWDVCPSQVSRLIDNGINLFMGDGCGDENALLARLRGQTFAVTDVTNGMTPVPGLIGWYYPDELDGRLGAPPSDADLKELAVDPPGGLLTFLTLTNHFYSGAEPLPLGRELYPHLAALANVLGFDLYPLQNWCRDDRFDAVYRAQRELEALAQGKPTYQWIEARQMDCAEGHLDPTAATVRAETWLAIAGGADGIGYFPNNWSDGVGAEIRELNSAITELAPALLGEPHQADSNQDLVKVGARVLNGAIYVIAVNSGRTPVQASIHVPGLGGRPLDVLDEKRQLATSNDEILTDTFDPLAVHIYVAAPPGWNTASTAQ